MYVAEVVNVPDGRSRMNTTDHGSTAASSIRPNDDREDVLLTCRVRRLKIFDLVELILKHRSAMEQIIRATPVRADLAPRFLAISLVSFVFYAVAMAFVLQSAHVWPQLASIQAYLDGDVVSLFRFESQDLPLVQWINGSVLHLIVAYAVGLVAATGICLPSLYFYGLLAGVRMSLMDIVLHALKSKATAAIALIGLLPIYAALAMGIVVLGITGYPQHVVLVIGLILPFIAGFWGTWSLYHGFLGLCDTMAESRRDRRQCFLRRLVLAWAACYTAVSPVMIYTLWEFLDRS